MNTGILKASWEKGWVSCLSGAACFLYLLNFTWLKWGDLVVDVGREMYLALELSSGKLLYRDIFYVYGPFSPYFNAVLFKALGAHLHSLIASGIITTVVVSTLIYKISRIFLNPLFSTLAVLTFLCVFAFGQFVYFGNYNFILPYSYPAIHGIMFSLAALYFFYRSFFKMGRYKSLYHIVSVLTFLCRIEIGLALMLSIALTLIIHGLSKKGAFKKLPHHLLIYVALPVVSTALIYGFFLVKAFDALKKNNALDIWFNTININNPFTRWLAGTQDILGNTAVIFKVFLYYLFFCVFFGLGGFIAAYVYPLRPVLARNTLCFLIGVLLIGIGAILFKKVFTYDLQYRCLPLICMLIIPVSLWEYLKTEEKTEYIFIITISLFSLFLMARVLLRAWAGHYGFYLLIPGMIIYYAFFLKILAGFLNFKIARILFSLGFLCIFILFIISHLNISRLCYASKTLKVSSPRGTLYVFDNDRENKCKELIEFLRDNTGREESLAVFPEGLTINFFAERENPLYFYSYLPVDLAKAEVAESIISDIRNKKVDYIALVQRDTTEYGYAVFGKDYAVSIWEYISDNYVLYKQFGPFPFTSAKYGIALFKRKA